MSFRIFFANQDHLVAIDRPASRGHDAEMQLAAKAIFTAISTLRARAATVPFPGLSAA